MVPLGSQKGCPSPLEILKGFLFVQLIFVPYHKLLWSAQWVTMGVSYSRKTKGLLGLWNDFHDSLGPWAFPFKPGLGHIVHTVLTDHFHKLINHPLPSFSP